MRCWSSLTAAWVILLGSGNRFVRTSYYIAWQVSTSVNSRPDRIHVSSCDGVRNVQLTDSTSESWFTSVSVLVITPDTLGLLLVHCRSFWFWFYGTITHWCNKTSVWKANNAIGSALDRRRFHLTDAYNNYELAVFCWSCDVCADSAVNWHYGLRVQRS
jgi:hypothetical protein